MAAQTPRTRPSPSRDSQRTPSRDTSCRPHHRTTALRHDRNRCLPRQSRRPRTIQPFPPLYRCRESSTRSLFRVRNNGPRTALARSTRWISWDRPTTAVCRLTTRRCRRPCSTARCPSAACHRHHLWTRTTTSTNS